MRLGGLRRPLHALQHCHQLVDRRIAEETFGTARGYIGERRSIELRRIDDAVFGQLIDDQIYELDLVRA